MGVVLNDVLLGPPATRCDEGGPTGSASNRVKIGRDDGLCTRVRSQVSHSLCYLVQVPVISGQLVESVIAKLKQKSPCPLVSDSSQSIHDFA